MKRFVLDNLKNIPGWRSNEKLVVFAVDDYGNVRLDSPPAWQKLSAAGLDMSSRFDQFDALETREDLQALFDVLSSVSDARGRSAIFTAYVLSANPDFDAMRTAETGYCYEPLPRTFERLADSQPAAYDGAWALWQEGVQEKLLKPQFHGREHLNVDLFERKKSTGDRALMLNLENRSMAALGGEPSMPGVGSTHAFGLWEKSEIDRHRDIIQSGLSLFKQIFGFASDTFTPPALKLHPELYTVVEQLGVQAIDKPLHCVRRLDKDIEVRELNVLGQKNGQNHVTVVRNVVFEPTNDPAVDSVQLALDQIAAAFRWRRPAIISSHRVNFCGHIDPENRKRGLGALKGLLDGIVARWPDVQFIGADELVERIRASA